MIQFLENLEKREGVYLLTPIKEDESYTEVRRREGRLVDDETLQHLPQVWPPHPHHREWQLRAESCARLRRYLSRAPQAHLLDLGCGNGWLTAQLSNVCQNVYGVDTHWVELAQAARVFPTISFLYGDLFTAALPTNFFEIIVVASAVQYFPDLGKLLERLRELLTTAGEIHLLDSPLYEVADVPTAKERTRLYYDQLGVPHFAERYHHHTHESLSPFVPTLLYNPAHWHHRLLRRSPFAWYKINAHQNF